MYGALTASFFSPLFAKFDGASIYLDSVGFRVALDILGEFWTAFGTVGLIALAAI